MNWEEKEREREKRLVELLAGFLREHLEKQGEQEQKVLEVPLRLREVFERTQGMVMALAMHERKTSTGGATREGVEAAECFHRLFDHIDKTLQLQEERFPWLRKDKQ